MMWKQLLARRLPVLAAIAGMAAIFAMSLAVPVWPLVAPDVNAMDRVTVAPAFTSTFSLAGVQPLAMPLPEHDRVMVTVTVSPPELVI